MTVVTRIVSGESTETTMIVTMVITTDGSGVETVQGWEEKRLLPTSESAG
jgi:hypothetical protein